MKKILFPIIALMLISAAAFAAEPFLPAAAGPVNDSAGIIDNPSEASINSLINELKQKTGAEIAVVTIKSLEGEPLEDYANTLFSKWGIGEKGKDNGLLILVVLDEHKIRIETGYGIEGIIPDGKAGSIIRTDMAPYFQQGNPAAGIYAGVYAAASLIAADKGVALSGKAPRSAQASRGKMSKAEMLFSIIFMLIFIPVVIRNPWILFLMMSGGRRGSGGGFGGGGFGGFGGGSSGGGGASGGW
ncbi:MAG: TPM domain-containing protein [Spirochaetia bacterium]|nr:TPM domain-containing protein [Spirochaetia bacterium]